MRILLFGSPGAYADRFETFIQNGHILRYVHTQYDGGLQLDGDFAVWRYEDLGFSDEERTAALRSLIQEEGIEIVYSLLNVWDRSSYATALLLKSGCAVPVVRQYKEHYMRPAEEERIAIEQSDACIFINEESRDYFLRTYKIAQPVFLADADLIPAKYLSAELSPKLHLKDQRPHFLIAGSAAADGGRYDYRRFIHELTRRKAHVHLYAQFRWLSASGEYFLDTKVARSYRNIGDPNYFHLHSPISPAEFVREWSQYDVGILHVPRRNDAFRVLNIPNRFSAYIAAGLPIAIKRGEMPAMERHLIELGAALLYESYDELVATALDRCSKMNVIQVRKCVTFESAGYEPLLRAIRSVL